MAETRSGAKISHWTARYIVVPLIVIAALLSLIPFIETNIWWIRYMDFARVQFLVALPALLVLYAVLRRPRTGLGWIPLGLAVLAIGYNLYRVYPYIPFWPEQAVQVAQCPADSRLRVLVANVQRDNEQAEEFFDIVRNTSPDLLLVMETDQWWDQRLAQLNNQFPHRVQHIPEGHAFFGMHLLSKYELLNPEVRFLFANFTPSIFTGVRLPDGTAVSFYGLHPQPPQAWSQPTTMRDAHLLAAALQARDSQTPSILAGDFNAVPWERVTRRAMRVGNLLDPRVGRGLYPTYDAESMLITWPLDQVLYQDRLALLEFEKLPAIGSDHYPVLASLCHLPSAAGRQSSPALEDGDLQEAQTAIEAARAMQPGRS
ncbi:endonuclease/exonuclease/phosphatase family protein [Microvirga sp. GCM10011540]|uniref:endonuclease/exonuclease/phosphatase family protein n=1 Tax=Microvirga sp. GCM10011540 TaxID=3317338 RepID=UPI0036195487